MIRSLDGLALALAGVVVSALALGWWRPEELFLALLGVIALRALLRPYRLPAWSPGRVVPAAVIAYAVVFSFITVTRHWAFRTHALDLGYYVQLLWSVSRGLGASVSLPEMHAWGDHFSPTLYLLVPLFALFPGPVFLLVAQSVAFSLGALPLFALARRRLGSEGAAAAFALLYLVSPTLHGINLRDFHAAALATPLLLAAVYCFETSRMGWFLASVILTLGCREDAALGVIGLGLWIALARRRWIWGLALVAGSLALFFFATQVLIPYFRGAPYPHLWRYPHLGGSLGEILLTMVLRPFRTLGLMVSVEKLRYLLALLAPLAFLPLRAPLDLLPALPTLAHNLLSLDPVLFSHRAQYNAFVLPFLLLAAVSGYARLSPRLTVRGRSIRGLALGLSFLLSLALTSRTLNDLAVNRWWLSQRQRAVYALLAQVPPGEPVSTQERFVPHLATRPKVFIFPVGIEKSEYVLLDGDSYPWRDLPDARLERTAGEVTLSVAGGEGRAHYRYQVVREGQGYLLLRRQAARKAVRAKMG
ncbi:MAG: DUF2079 domain-containing protein [Candidatus Rokubacteria bacterium]|nr:DUF2079 domain-containing protein [Candidatus Rokubacteria bacterium]